MQDQISSNGNQTLDIGVRTIQRDYDSLIAHLQANDVLSAQTAIAALKKNIESMKVLSGFTKGAALATQGVIQHMIKGLIDLMTDTESSIRSLTAQKRDVQANRQQLEKVLADKLQALHALEMQIEKARLDLEAKEREKAAKRSSNIPIWKWLKRGFYAALDAINAAIDALKRVLHLARDQQNGLERELADLAKDSAALKLALEKLETRRQTLQTELDQLGLVKQSLTDVKQYMQVQLVFFNDVANFYARAATRCESVAYDIDDVREIILLLDDDTPVIDYFESTRIERLSLLSAVTRFDQMVISAYHALEASPA
ncbi:hypothetical protein RAS12_03900 [Achromobacter seleniivolatilans]|uniref:Binary cytotoxin component n=1 Tax=Achromobacter seleniivolatilans TaxID=3047478 RepID=A0ABY9M3E4_9BURK|nr:hypothetical protein [Achromobacter sp. R39]WMD21526.1 hypothetical protein RAS12_03900 [Achromobacter sp. R39]